MSVALTAPAPLAPQHDCSAFDCGNAELSDWLRQRAQDSQAMHGSRCFAVCDGSRIAAFYAWAAASVERRNVRGSIRRDMPEPVPAVLLGRLAVDCGWQGRGLGADLLQGTPRCVPCERLMKSARAWCFATPSTRQHTSSICITVSWNPLSTLSR